MGNKKTKNDREAEALDHETLVDLSKKTKLSKDEILSWYKGFIHDCPSGRLYKNLFIKTYKQLYPDLKSTRFAKLLFDTLDIDKNGYITFDEFIFAVGIVIRGTLEDKLNLAFHLADLNNDGVIERKEARLIISSLFCLLGDKLTDSKIDRFVEKFMNDFDQDNNGVLTKDEFINGCFKRVKELMGDMVA